MYEYKNPKGKSTTYTFITTNKDDIDLIKDIGIKERKSLTLEMPKIKKYYYSHLIRGVFDGDGSVYKKESIELLYRYMYIDAEQYLSRKKQKFEMMI